MTYLSCPTLDEMSAIRVLTNNCVSEIKVPKDVESAHTVDYNPVLGLYATVNRECGRVFVWNPVSEEVVASLSTTCDGFSGAIFLPGDRVGVSASETHHGGDVEIHTLDGKKSRCLKMEGDQLHTTYPGPIALSPRKTLLLADVEDNCREIVEVFVDCDNLKVLKYCTIDLSPPKHEEDEEEEDDMCGTDFLCCLPDFKIISYEQGKWGLSVAKVRTFSKEEVRCEERYTITYYMLEDQKKELKGIHDEDSPVYGVTHDSEHLIIGNGDEVVLLESMTEGTTAHLIADVKVYDFGQAGVRINEKGQLMVCNDTVIKVFEYNCNPRTLMALCRCNIRKITPNDYRSWVNTLAIPQLLKDYLLYEQVQAT
ncbi:uncharacterized protein LOC114953548 [Acropora millepora]|uniref:uncharacterized protein LOC114953548 n=1 Tax=Acropora millepora TaxID=45264 RepID=UPI001CF36637|nr:uncharacterized protein LOC114953548 [Acropora millepora]